jgi:hypothetical protein
MDFETVFLDGVIGRRGISIQLPPAILAKNAVLNTMEEGTRGKSIFTLSGPPR